jgi:hypothetical protein
MSSSFWGIVCAASLATLPGFVVPALAAAESAPPAANLGDALRGGWVTDIDGARHIFILKVRGELVSGVYCDVDCGDPARLSVLERGSLTSDGVRFQIRRLDNKTPRRVDVNGRLVDNQLLLSAGARRWTLQRDPRKPALVTVEEMFARRGIVDGPLVLSGSPNPYTPPGPNESLAPAALEGLWLFGTGPGKQHFTFRQVGDRMLGVVCGACDNPYTFGFIDNVAIRGDTLTFDINHEDAGIGIEFGPFENHATATLSRHEMHLHSVQHAGSRTIEGDLVLIGPVRGELKHE